MRGPTRPTTPRARRHTRPRDDTRPTGDARAQGINRRAPTNPLCSRSAHGPMPDHRRAAARPHPRHRPTTAAAPPDRTRATAPPPPDRSRAKSEPHAHRARRAARTGGDRGQAAPPPTAEMMNKAPEEKKNPGSCLQPGLIISLTNYPEVVKEEFVGNVCDTMESIHMPSGGASSNVVHLADGYP